jgi:stage V sporulation protein AC
MKMTKAEYGEYIKKLSPNSNTPMNLLRAFISGGVICVVGQGMLNLYKYYGLSAENAAMATGAGRVRPGAL